MHNKKGQKPDAPLVSILMNCHNGERFLEEAIDSIQAQTFADWEIVFWDNASTDRSGEIAKSCDQRLKYWRSEQKSPLGEARNLAMQHAAGKYVAFLDCDDLYLPDKLEKQARLMEEGGYAMSYGGAIVIDEQGVEKRRLAAKNRSGYLFPALLKHYEINMPSVMILRSILIRERLSFLPNFQYCPDYNLFMEIAARHPVGVLGDFVVKYRRRADSLSEKTLHRAPGEIQYTLDHILQCNPSLVERHAAAVRSAYAKLHYYEAVNLIRDGLYKKARRALHGALFKRWEYLALYLLLFLPLSPHAVLRLLKRAA